MSDPVLLPSRRDARLLADDGAVFGDETKELHREALRSWLDQLERDHGVPSADRFAAPEDLL